MPDNEQVQTAAKSASLTDILIQIEDFLDSLDLYVFKNWFDGEIVDGPVVKRYWVGITLQYDYKDMPDPTGGMRLISRGCKVFFWKAKKEVAQEITSPDNFRDDGRHSKPVMEQKDIWLVEIQIPRRFINDLDASDLLAVEDAGVEQDLAQDAQDEDIDADATQDVDPDGVADDESDDGERA